MEGKTEKVFMPYVRKYLGKILAGRMPRLDTIPYDGRVPTGEKLKRVVENLLSGRSRNPADYVLALTDVYTGTNDFKDASDAKDKMKKWVGNEPRFYPHAAQYDFEAWLLPYWPRIQELTKQEKKAPSGNPETVNHCKPPSCHIREIFEMGDNGYGYVKTRDVRRILEGQDLSVAIAQCPELKAFVNTIISVCNLKQHTEADG
ncbi:MAG: DUF4276 family protein [Synergistaceae bacterium]|nr:DUF4276 family protein [Synergistaceae bacterium]